MSSPSLDSADINLPLPDLHSDAHFLRAVTEMADSQELIAARPVYSASGIKLLEQGMRLNSRMYERLIQHRLCEPLDDQITAQDIVDRPCLQSHVLALSQSSPLGRMLVRFMGDKHPVLQEVLRYMKWPERASFKLTVMRSQLPALLEHSVLMMMVAVWVAVEEKLSLDDCAELAAAALLHDVGMLYMPLNWTDPRYKLNSQERKKLAAHSVTSMLLVRSTHAYSARAEDAVLQHHERLDGSGYPRHIKDAEITPWGRILMVAEVVSAFFSKFTDIPAQRLSLMLRMNHSRFDGQLVQHVFRLLAHETQDQELPLPAGQTSAAQVRNIIATLGAVFQYWYKCKNNFADKWQNSPYGRAYLYVDTRMASIEKSLAESGSHPRQQADWLLIFEQDPLSMTEVVMINKEALWQVEACVEACIRRWPQLLQPATAFEAAMRDWLLNSRSVLAHDDAAAPASAPAEADVGQKV